MRYKIKNSEIRAFRVDFSKGFSEVPVWLLDKEVSFSPYFDQHPQINNRLITDLYFTMEWAGGKFLVKNKDWIIECAGIFDVIDDKDFQLLYEKIEDGQ